VRRCWEIEPDRIVLECHQCGELIIVLGCEENWYTGGNIAFECECGQRLTIASEPRKRRNRRV
jgi:hypothetical protein